MKLVNSVTSIKFELRKELVRFIILIRVGYGFLEIISNLVTLKKNLENLFISIAEQSGCFSANKIIGKSLMYSIASVCPLSHSDLYFNSPLYFIIVEREMR
jgi:hypothetical protein